MTKSLSACYFRTLSYNEF